MSLQNARKRILVFHYGRLLGIYIGYESVVIATNVSEWQIRKRLEDGKETKQGYSFDIPCD
ncbi:MAG: hypothetical protein CVV46_03740 [Spirochaetae bacterium HGW-Spirochaetae-2]|jgi:hypothetical protein|nr:MAG: hypothetical protein CVV46_03740 [Spirochaetae bacterium HGW-Spirochaetae-2]